MVQDPFLQYLDRATTVERKLAFQNAYQSLTTAGLRDHIFRIDQMMEMEDLGDSSDFLLAVEVLLNGALHAVVLQFGVTLDPACTMAMSAEILTALLAMDNWSEPSALSQAAEIDETPEVVLAVMLGITGPHHETDYLPHLTHVSVNLINRIDSVNQTVSASALPSPEEHTRAQSRLTAFFSAYSAPILSQAISEMLLIGGDYKGLLSSYEAQISALPMETAVNELVGFALASELPNGDKLRQAVLEECQGWWDGDAANATKLNGLTTDRLKKANAL